MEGLKALMLMLLIVVRFSSCEELEHMKNTEKSAATGAIAGGIMAKVEKTNRAVRHLAGQQPLNKNL